MRQDTGGHSEGVPGCRGSGCTTIDCNSRLRSFSVPQFTGFREIGPGAHQGRFIFSLGETRPLGLSGVAQVACLDPRWVTRPPSVAFRCDTPVSWT